MFNIFSHDENGIQNCIEHHVTSDRMAIIKKAKTTNAGEDARKNKSLNTVGRNAN
jgi:hypothetical protein